MFCFPLSNWTTMRGAQTITTINQSESQWLDLRGFEDIVAWLECKNVTLSGATNITLAYQTAPTKDDSLFANAITAINLAAGSVTVSKVLMSTATIPLARWLRWQLAPSGGTLTASWDATFRVWIAANIGPHPLRPRIQVPPTRPNGKSCNGDCQKGGSRPISPSPTGMVPPTGMRAAGSSMVQGNTQQARNMLAQRRFALNPPPGALPR